MADNRLEPLVLSEDERRTLESWALRRSTAQGLALRARIVLACARGSSNLAVAAQLGVNRGPVREWRTRFLRDRLDGLHDEPRPGVPRTITDAQVEQVVVRTLEEVPVGAAHWSKRELAQQAGISPSSVLRIWRAFGLEPWRTETFKISPDPLATEKIRDVADLYLAPPANAVVLSVDENRRSRPCSGRAGAAHAAGSARAPQLRLRAARHRGPVRRTGHRHRQGDRQAVRPAPGHRLPRPLGAIGHPKDGSGAGCRSSTGCSPPKTASRSPSRCLSRTYVSRGS